MVTARDILNTLGPDRRYPCVEPADDSPVQWREDHLYGIVGWMSSWYQGVEEATAFGGYFRYNPRDFQIGGHTTDLWGNGIIEGKMTRGQLTFSKSYVTGTRFPRAVRPPISYTFDQAINDKGLKIWKGKFSMPDAPEPEFFEGRAECVLTRFHINAFGIITPPVNFRPFR